MQKLDMLLVEPETTADWEIIAVAVNVRQVFHHKSRQTLWVFRMDPTREDGRAGWVIVDQQGLTRGVEWTMSTAIDEAQQIILKGED